MLVPAAVSAAEGIRRRQADPPVEQQPRDAEPDDEAGDRGDRRHEHRPDERARRVEQADPEDQDGQAHRGVHGAARLPAGPATPHAWRYMRWSRRASEIPEKRRRNTLSTPIDPLPGLREQLGDRRSGLPGRAANLRTMASATTSLRVRGRQRRDQDQERDEGGEGLGREDDGAVEALQRDELPDAPAGERSSPAGWRRCGGPPTDPAARPPPGDPPDGVRAGVTGPPASPSHAPARPADARCGAPFHPERMTPRRPGSGTVALIRAHVRDVPPEEHR